MLALPLTVKSFQGSGGGGGMGRGGEEEGWGEETGGESWGEGKLETSKPTPAPPTKEGGRLSGELGLTFLKGVPSGS